MAMCRPGHSLGEKIKAVQNNEKWYFGIPYKY